MTNLYVEVYDKNGKVLEDASAEFRRLFESASLDTLQTTMLYVIRAMKSSDDPIAKLNLSNYSFLLGAKITQLSEEARKNV